jgi:hypothetical protein
VKVIVGERTTGRTTALCRWALQGHALEGAPGWSRIILTVTHAARRDTVRRLREETLTWGGDRDAASQVFRDADLLVHVFPDADGIRRAPTWGWSGVECAIDNLDLLLRGILEDRIGPAVEISTATLCGEAEALGDNEPSALVRRYSSAWGTAL